MKLTATQLRKIIMEEVSLAKTGGKDPQRFLHGFESGHPTDDEGYMVKSRMAAVKEMAETICDLLEMEDQLPGWVQDLVAGAHRDMEHVKDYLVGDEKLRSYNGHPKPMAQPVGESRRHRGNRLSEGHARITDAEFAAWKRGDWGFVSESAGGYKEMTASQAAAFIAAKDPTETVEQDIVDVETGEIYAEEGQSYGRYQMKPGRTKMNLGDIDDTTHGAVTDAGREYDAALAEFASNWAENPVSDVPPEDIAADAALSFFDMYPRWRTWATELGLTKADIQRAAAESVFEALS